MDYIYILITSPRQFIYNWHLLCIQKPHTLWQALQAGRPDLDSRKREVYFSRPVCLERSRITQAAVHGPPGTI